MAPESAGRGARLATFALMAVAYAACEVAAYPDGRPRSFGVIYGLAVLAVAALLSAVVPAPVPGRRLPARWAAGLALAFALPLAAEPLLREWTGEGFPLELQLVNGLRTLGLLLAGVSAWSRPRRLAGGVALFLALFATAMGDQPAIPYLLAAFALAGGVWLVLNHRADADDAAAATLCAESGRASLKLPLREAAAFAVLAVAAGGLAVAGPKRTLLVLGELVPTSGGSGATDPFARSGVGDGPEETAGENARAAGMVETDRMIEDTKDALIDAVSDMYGPPHKPPKDQQRMAAAGKADIIENHGRLPDNRRPSRDFDTGRAGPKRDGLRPQSTAARGLFEVEGRTPLHVRVAAYDAYDPAAGRWAEARRPSGRLIEDDGGDWMRVGKLRDHDDWYANDDRHRLKAADLRENLVPTPALTTRFRIAKVNRPDYYEWDYDGVLALAGRKRTPPGVVVTTDCRTLDPAGLPAAAFLSRGVGQPESPGEVPPGVDRLAAEWAGGLPRGWPQVEAIAGRLRDDYTLDRAASAPAGHPDPAEWFLAESRRGPDYLFATSAALMLRSLGYSARVCLGYYAAPAAFDDETGHTPVKASDLHFWPEVQLSDGHWLVVEPTPGYSVLPPLKPWRERLADALTRLAAWAARHALALVATGLMLAAGVVFRRRLLDAMLTARWRLAPDRGWRAGVLGAVRLLERRGRLAGTPRPAGQTLAGWRDELLTRRPDGGALDELICLAEWAAYAPGLPPPADGQAVASACRAAVTRWTLAAFAPTPRTPA